MNSFCSFQSKPWTCRNYKRFLFLHLWQKKLLFSYHRVQSLVSYILIHQGDWSDQGYKQRKNKDGHWRRSLALTFGQNKLKLAALVVVFFIVVVWNLAFKLDLDWWLLENVIISSSRKWRQIVLFWITFIIFSFRSKKTYLYEKEKVELGQKVSKISKIMQLILHSVGLLWST